MRRNVIQFNKTITKYILLELLAPGLLGLAIFTFVLLMDKVLDLIQLVINKGVNLNVVLKLVMYIMPSFLVLTIPMAVLVATLTAFGRLSTDSEITAMKASGISLYTLFAPVSMFATAACGITFFLYAQALPWGNHNFRKTLYELARTNAAIGLKAQVFNSTFPGLVIYIDTVSDADKSFAGIMISDSRDQKNPQTIFARKGRLISDEKALRVILRLENGISHPKFSANTLKYQIVEFPTLDILLNFQGDANQSNIEIPLSDREKHITQLTQDYFALRKQETSTGQSQAIRLPTAQTPWRQRYRQYGSIAVQLVWESFSITGRLSSPYLVEIHKRFSIPLACLVFGLIGTPLGIQSRRAGKSGGYGISVVLLLIYYIFITAGESLGDDGKIPAFLAAWTPNILLGVTGIFLLIRMARR